MKLNGQLHVQGALPPEKYPPPSIVYKAKRTLEPVWMLWRREKNRLSMVRIENRYLGRPTLNLVAKTTKLSY
jgi:hypothetical protein